jgi:hypothetical protein
MAAGSRIGGLKRYRAYPSGKSKRKTAATRLLQARRTVPIFEIWALAYMSSP